MLTFPAISRARTPAKPSICVGDILAFTGVRALEITVRSFFLNLFYSNVIFTVSESGFDISKLEDAECLLLFNHLTGSDMFLLCHFLAQHERVTPDCSTVMFYGMKWSPLGLAYQNHADIFLSLVTSLPSRRPL